MKNRVCKQCGAEYTPRMQAQPRCKPCMEINVKEKVFKNLKKQVEKPLKKTPLKIKIDKKWIVISKAVKMRDNDLPCISCLKFMPLHSVEAGHYISRAKSTILKYNMYNIHSQCWHCNNILFGNVKEYRKNLIIKIGLEKVEWLENNK